MAFHRYTVNDDNFIRGAARLLLSAITQAFPTSIGDIVNLTTYDAQTGWTDAGATKTGITITNNNTEETFDIDQELTDIDSRPTGYEVTVATALEEVDLEHLQIAWEAGAIATVGSERQMGIGTPTVYVKRRLAVVFQKANNKLRAFVFRKAQKSPQESAVVFNKTGEQQSVAVRWRALPDPSIAVVTDRIAMIFDQ
jgi:ribosome-binding ATPase YchF (GTP1/OBG family)